MGFLEGLFWLTLNIYHEARGESLIGQLAVAHVTLNRAAEQNRSLADVVKEPYQFSWTFQKSIYYPTENRAFIRCMRTALTAMTTADFTDGATYYHNLDVEPEWKNEKTYVDQYGRHIFYRD